VVRRPLLPGAPEACLFCGERLDFNFSVLSLFCFSYQWACGPCAVGLHTRCSALEVNPW